MTARHVAVVAPSDVEAERSVLGAILLGAAEGSAAPLDAVRATGLAVGDFYLDGHGAILAAMLALAERGTVPDVLALAAELERIGKLDAAGGKARLAELAKLAPATSNAAHHARLVLDAAERRRALNGGLTDRGELRERLWMLLDRPRATSAALVPLDLDALLSGPAPESETPWCRRGGRRAT